MNILVKAHSGLRYVVLLLLVIAIFNAIAGIKKGEYLKKDKMINLFTMISLHIQLLLGLILYFTSEKVQFIEGFMKNPQYRFYAIEHILMMLIAIVLITIGRKKAEKKPNDTQKHRKILQFYTVGLILIFLAIPWPFLRNVGAGWF
ncbi:MAG: hypothetical protein ACPGU5_03975 [Lishizhenia sp.]